MSKEEVSDSDSKKALFAVSDAVLGAAILLAIGVYAGGWLDKQFHTQPILSITLAILGGGLGLARMVIKAKSLDTNKSGNLPKAIGYVDKDDESYLLNKSAKPSNKDEDASKESKEITGASGAAKDAKEFDTTRQRLPFEDFE